MSKDEPRIDLCSCEAFVLWYVDQQDVPDIPVCFCGHPDAEHLDGKGSCTGKIEVR